MLSMPSTMGRKTAAETAKKNRITASSSTNERIPLFTVTLVYNEADPMDNASVTQKELEAAYAPAHF